MTKGNLYEAAISISTVFDDFYAEFKEKVSTKTLTYTVFSCSL
jgi:hypothetical protein